MHTRIFFSCLAVSCLTGLAACSQNGQRSSQSQAPADAPVLIDGASEAVAASRDQAQSDRTIDAAPTREERRKSLAAAQITDLAVSRAMQKPMAGGVVSTLQAPAYAVPPSINRENYATVARNEVRRVSQHPVSTFSVDVDTGSYANVRRFLSQGRLPPKDAVRVEELINNFDYAYAAPTDLDAPFAVATEMTGTPWNRETQLLQIGIQGWKPVTKPVGTNLVFLVDVSGSMRSANKLPLVKTALNLLLEELGPNDRISLVVYAGASGVVLEPTPGDQRATISAALQRLEAGGSTNGGAGIQLAYAMARQGWIEGGVNRVLLATDGDFNVGTTRFESLIDLVESRRRSGIALTTLGFGSGNYNDQLMEQLADAGDGNHAYIDSVQEAHKVLVRQREATLTTIARDVKIQIEFNPAAVSEYRLIGYENRALRNSDFANDAVDAGDIGAGHTVTALYEVALVGSDGERNRPLRYARPTASVHQGLDTELAHLRLRYKLPEEGTDARSKLIERPIHRAQARRDFAESSQSLKLAVSVAAFGQLLSGGSYLDGFDYTDVAGLAESLKDDPFGDVAGFRQLVQVAGSLSHQAHMMRGDAQEIGG